MTTVRGKSSSTRRIPCVETIMVKYISHSKLISEPRARIHHKTKKLVHNGTSFSMPLNLRWSPLQQIVMRKSVFGQDLNLAGKELWLA